MKFDLSQASAADLQDRFWIADCAPFINGSDHRFCFELDSNRIGFVGLSIITKIKRITWNPFRPFCPHLSESELRRKPSGTVLDNNTDKARMTFCNWHEVPEGLEGIGLGTLAHTLVVRWLCRNVLESDSYTTTYFPNTVGQRLRNLLDSSGVADMIDGLMPLKEVESRMTTNAEEIFGFRFRKENVK